MQKSCVTSEEGLVASSDATQENEISPECNGRSKSGGSEPKKEHACTFSLRKFRSKHLRIADYVSAFLICLVYSVYVIRLYATLPTRM